jgi:large repetitive protein
VRPQASVSVLSETLLKGESSEVRIVFSEPVTGFGIEDLKVPNARLASLSSGDGGMTWAAKLIPQENLSQPLNVIELDLSGVRNAAGNGANPGLGIVQSNVYAIATLDGVRGTVDGVATITQSTPDSSGGKTVVVPVITTSRPDDPTSPHSTLADIPLGLSNGAGGNSLLVSLPTGTGLQSDGPSAPLSGASALTDLIQRIESKTQAGSSTQSEMTGLGTNFLGELGIQPLETKTLVPTAAAGAASAGTIIISGNTSNPVGLVIDTSHLPSNSTLQLDNVDFAAVVGAVTLRGGEGRNIVIGDSASQNIYLGPDDDVLAGGGGDDFVGSAGGDDRLDGGSGNDLVAGGTGNDTLSGGSGDDMVQGGRSDIGNWRWTLTTDGVLAATHTNAVFAAGGTETLQRGDFNAQGENLGFLAAPTDYLIGASLLYRAAFGRAPEAAGLSYWSQPGMQLSDLAKGILQGAEWLADNAASMGNTEFVQTLYRHVLGRDGEVAGMTYWVGVLAGGAGRAEVLQYMALSDEHRKAALGTAGYTIVEDRNSREMGWGSGSGDDILDGGAGSDVLVGGDGTDTAVYGGKLADYRFVLGKDGHVLVADKANGDSDTLSSIELGKFQDGTVDLRFLQSKPAELATLGMLYQSVLDRPGDLGGFTWWLGQHRDTASLVQGFLGADEVKARYDGISDAAFVQALYANAGLASTAAGGTQAWVSYAASHTKAELVGAWIANDDVQAAQFGAQGLWIA